MACISGLRAVGRYKNYEMWYYIIAGAARVMLAEIVVVGQVTRHINIHLLYQLMSGVVAISHLKQLWVI